jgi:hypothetical protein
MSTKTNLVGLTREGLAQALTSAGVEPKQVSMRVQQLWNAMYVQGVTDFDGITTLAKPLRQEFSNAFAMTRPEVVTAQVSRDGTRKWVIRFAPGIEIETVFIPDEDRGTLCISSQVGCTLNCRFCHTGTQKLVRNLTAAEIVARAAAQESAGAAPPVVIERLRWADPWRWLALGLRDARAAPGIAAFYGTCVVLMALVLGWVFRTRPEYTMSMASGCLLVGPFLAMGLYDTSRRREAGLPPSLGESLTCWDSHMGSMGMLVLVLVVLELLWGRASLVVFAVFFNTGNLRTQYFRY